MFVFLCDAPPKQLAYHEYARHVHVYFFRVYGVYISVCLLFSRCLYRTVFVLQDVLGQFVSALRVNGKNDKAALAKLGEHLKKVRTETVAGTH